MDSLVDPLSREYPEDRVVLRAPGNPPASYRYQEFVETVWKTGNYFRRLGTHREATVAVVPHTSAAVPLSIFGAALNGTTVRLDPPTDVAAKLLVSPADRVGEFDLPPGAQRVVHTGPADDPGDHSFGEGVWSENAFFPEDRIFVESAGMADGVRRLDHAEIVERVPGIADEIDESDEVVVRVPLDDVRAVLAGIVLPLWAGASIQIASGGESTGEGSVAITSSGADVPEERSISLESV